VSFSSDQILGFLREVKMPAQKIDIVSQGLVKRCDVRESSAVIEIEVDELNPMTEKSLNYQVTSTLQKKAPELSVSLTIQAKPQAPQAVIPTIIAVGSGKGGVGKSSVTTNLAFALKKLGYHVGILDCDVYGPSIPTMMGVEGQKPMMLDSKIQPVIAHGIPVMSAGFFVEPGQGLIWRGPMIHKLIHQFIHDVDWKDVDILLVDLPPGTGDAPLSLAQNIPLTGALMVSTPQHVSLIDVHKGVAMMHQVKVPVLGIIENMSHYVCPSCHHEDAIFDQGGVQKFCDQLSLPYMGDIPIDPRVRIHADKGEPYLATASEDSAVAVAFAKIAKRLQPSIKTKDDLEPIRLVL
jgi:ATP-binding protein involved in chromosome partitioning